MTYEFIDHTADIIARAHGTTIDEAFAEAARAMFDVITGGAEIKTERKVEFEVESVDREGLLVGFLSDLIVIHEADRVVLSEFDIEFVSDRHLRAVVCGEDFDFRRHGEGTHVKGISYHMMEITENPNDNSWTVQVLFDI